METATKYHYEKASDSEIMNKLNDIHSALLKENQTTQTILSNMYLNLDRKVDDLTNDVLELKVTTKEIKTTQDSELKRSNELKDSSLAIMNNSLAMMDKTNTRFHWAIVTMIGLASLVVGMVGVLVFK